VVRPILNIVNAVKETVSSLVQSEQTFLEGFLDQSIGPCELVMRVGPDAIYHLIYVNAFAAQAFGLRRVQMGEAPLSWDDLPDALAQYFSNVFEVLALDKKVALPILELETPKQQAYATKVQTRKQKEPDGWYFWFHFAFNDVTPWLGLQEEVMNARKLESIGALASGVAHDFNNLIMAIQGHAEFLLMTRSNDAELSAAMSRIIKVCTNGASLTRSLLGYARRQSLLMDVLHLGGLVQDVIELCRHSYGSRYEIKTDAGLGVSGDGASGQGNFLIMGCYSALSHSLLNVMNNSRDAMPEGGVIHLSSHQENGWVFLTVSDQGTGIQAEDLDRIFEPFFTTKEMGAGTGLGLPMVQGIMQQHGGRISVESEVGHGTQVTFSWPLHRQGQEAEPDHPLIEESREFPLPAALDVPKRAFVIEDNEIVMESVRSLLQLNEFDVECFDKAEEVIELVRQGSIPGMILVDYTMPGMDGLQFIRTLYGDFRQMEKPPYIKVVLMSGYPPEHFTSFMEEFKGVPLYLLQKPFSSETLSKLIGTRQRRFLRKITSRVNILPHKR
jgi:signal transduction histidine kinase/CheY-like chemotaxis protein